MPSSIGLWYGPTSSSPRSSSALRPASMRSPISSSDVSAPTGRLLRLDELALEGVDLFGVEELHEVQRLVRPARGTASRP